MSFSNLSIGELEAQGAVVAIQDGNHGGQHPKSSDYMPEGVPFVMASNFSRDGTVDISACSKLSVDRCQQLRIGFAKDDDVLFTHKGTVGLTAIVKGAEPYWMLTPQVTYYRVNKEKLNPQFLMYAFRSPYFQSQLGGISAQSTRPYISITTQRSLRIDFCDISHQLRIAGILSAYDDLIKVNQRRIAILEDMARRLFDEWFVRFRYPGHETVPLVETELGPTPQGWEISRLGALLQLKYGKALKADERQPGEVAVYGSSGVVGSHDQALVRGPGIVVGRKGNVGSIHWSTGDFYPIDTVFYVESEYPLRWLAQLLRRQTFLNSDAAVPGLNREQALRMKVLRPPSKLVHSYASWSEPLLQQAELLSEQSKRLRAVRDLLLPKLISGEIDVSGAERELAQAAE